MSNAGDTNYIALLIQDLIRRALENFRVPAEKIDNQISQNNLGPHGNTGSGYSPADHASDHEDGGGDELSLGSIAGTLSGDSQHGSLGGGSDHALATISSAGFFSPSDKIKLDSLSTASFTNPMTATGDMIYGIAGATMNEARPARGATGSESGHYFDGWGGDYHWPKAFDADDSTAWSPGPTAGQWVRADLGSAKTITAWRVAQGASGAATSYKLQSSNDDSTWTDRVTSGAVDSGVTPLASPITARYWRILGVTGPNPWFIASFELYSGTPDGTADRLPIGTSGQVLTVVSGLPAWAAPSSSGSVTSVGLAAPGEFSVSGSPVTSTGTLTLAWANETANLVFAGPSTGSPAVPAFRALVPVDIPDLSATYAPVSHSHGLSASDVWNWKAPAQSGDPGSNNVGVNTDLPAVATTLYLNRYGTNSTDYGGVLDSLTAGDSIYLQQQDDATKWIRYNVTGDPTVTGSAYAIPVEAHGGTLGGEPANNTATWVQINEIGGVPSGTVTSVGLAAPSEFSVSGSPVTVSGTLTLAWANASANQVLAGPSTGSPAAPTFRALASGDIPDLSATYQPLDSDLTAIAALTTTSYGRALLTQADAAATRAYIGAGTGDGSVTSVALTMPAIFSVSGSPITTSGTFAVTLATATANTVFAGPSSGAAAAPTFRALASTDIPDLSASYQPLDSDLTAIAALSTTSYGRGLLPLADAAAARAYIGAGTGSGTVTSVGIGVPSELSVAGSPVTSSGTITLAWVTQAINKVFASPASGSAAAPAFRSLVANDLPATAVTPGSYTNTNLTVDAQGRITAASSGAGGGTITGSGTAGQAAFWSGTSALAGDSGFIWDNTNKRLGIGAAAPGWVIEAQKSDTTAGRTGAIGAEIAVTNSGTGGAVNAGIRFRTSDTGVITRSAARIVGTYLAGFYTDTALIFQTMSESETFQDAMTIRGLNVGIGTNAPYSKLHLHDAANTVDSTVGKDIILSRYWASSSNVRASSIFHYYHSTAGMDMLCFGVASDLYSSIAPNQFSQAKMLITATGRVGIGEGLSVPLGKLHARTSGGANVLLWDGTINGTAQTIVPGGAGYGAPGAAFMMFVAESVASPNVALNSTMGQNFGPTNVQSSFNLNACSYVVTYYSNGGIDIVRTVGSDTCRFAALILFN